MVGAVPIGVTGAPHFDLPPGVAHVWWSRTVSWQPGRWAVLSPAERIQHDRFRRPQDRHRYLTAHALARIVLGGYLGRSPATLEFAARCGSCGGAHGKPYLAEAGTDLEFSLSHSGPMVCVAVARFPLGVDVEEVASYAEVPELLDETLSESERASWSTLPEVDRPTAFLRYWTRKEAALKATGDGLAVSPRSVVVSAPGAAPALVSWARAGDPLPIRLVDLHPGSGFVASLAALRAEPPRVDERDGARLLTRQPNRRNRRGP